MENENTSVGESNKKEKNKKMMPIVAGVIVVVLVAFYAMWNRRDSEVDVDTTNNVVPESVVEVREEEVAASAYKDGTYEAVGTYRSPGGDESIEVSLTLEDSVVTDANVESNATLPPSIRFQGEFIEAYKEQVVGKNIDELSLDKVSGSSLTPKGFNDAVEKIKTQAQA